MQIRRPLGFAVAVELALAVLSIALETKAAKGATHLLPECVAESISFQVSRLSPRYQLLITAKHSCRRPGRSSSELTDVKAIFLTPVTSKNTQGRLIGAFEANHGTWNESRGLLYLRHPRLIDSHKGTIRRSDPAWNHTPAVAFDLSTGTLRSPNGGYIELSGVHGSPF